MSKYKPYKDYKVSNVDWLGDIPSHWICTNLKRYCNVTDGSHHSPKIQENGYPFISVTDVGINSINFEAAKKISEKDYIRLVKEGCKPKIGDVLLTKDGTIGRACIVDGDMQDFVILSSLGLLTPSDRLANRFLYYYLVSGINVDQMNSMIHGSALRRMTISKIDQLIVTFPPFNEQEQIANFLDHETAKIDILIEKQQQLIKLLKEKRQTVISHAVTKGLNPEAPMKDFGVEWLGEVPEHWVVAQLKFNTVDMQTGPFGSQLHADDYIEDGIPLINPAHMIEGELIPDPKVTVDDEAQRRLSRHKLNPGDIIFARRGELGRCAIVRSNQKGWLCGTGSLRATLNQRLLPDYAFLLITSEGLKAELSLESKGSTMDNLNTETLGKVRTPVPPTQEQTEILKHVKDVSGKYKELLDKALTAIELMKERRTALISAAVTGKIDVRSWIKPEEREEEVA